MKNKKITWETKRLPKNQTVFGRIHSIFGSDSLNESKDYLKSHNGTWETKMQLKKLKGYIKNQKVT